MKCKHNDCFTCPYPDCIAGSSMAYADPSKLEESRQKRVEYSREHNRKGKKQNSFQ